MSRLWPPTSRSKRGRRRCGLRGHDRCGCGRGWHRLSHRTERGPRERPWPSGHPVAPAHTSGAAGGAPVRDRLDPDLLAGEREVHEAVLVVEAVSPRRVLRGDAPAAAGDDVRRGVEGVPGVPDLLRVPVARDDEVYAVGARELRPGGHAPGTLGWEMSHDDLPLGRGTGQALAQPPLLGLPERLEPVVALTYGSRALRPAICVSRVVQCGADVVSWVLLRVSCVKKVVVHKVIID
mmetsp:Transcript_132221/g.368578  ORF Transcript_132221/g.368578 Transcript_132221/m.368578 type:complete len:236 (+) Transcript_132221:229-936(+)